MGQKSDSTDAPNRLFMSCLEALTLWGHFFSSPDLTLSCIFYGAMGQGQSIPTCRVSCLCKVLSNLNSAFQKEKKEKKNSNIQYLLIINDRTFFDFSWIHVSLRLELRRCVSQEYCPMLDSVSDFLSLMLGWYALTIIWWWSTGSTINYMVFFVVFVTISVFDLNIFIF